MQDVGEPAAVEAERADAHRAASRVAEAARRDDVHDLAYRGGDAAVAEEVGAVGRNERRAVRREAPVIDDGADAVRARYLPAFFGYSMDDVRRWNRGGDLSAHKQPGQVWRWRCRNLPCSAGRRTAWNC